MAIYNTVFGKCCTTLASSTCALQMNCKPDTKWTKCKRNENVFKVTTTTRAANLHNPEQQIVTNWKLFSAKIVSDCLCKPTPPPFPLLLIRCDASHFALFYFSFSLLLLSPVPVAIVIIKVAQITRKIQQLKLTARQYENQPHTHRGRYRYWSDRGALAQIRSTRTDKKVSTSLTLYGIV